MKVLEIEDEGFVWHVPLMTVAEKRADFYSDDPDTTREEEIEYVMNDGYEGIDWFRNNMDFADVSEVAVLVSSPEPKTEPDISADCTIIETQG